MSRDEWITEKSLEPDLSALMIPVPKDTSADPAAGQASSALMPAAVNVPRMRRTVHVSTMSAFALSLPSALYSLMCLTLLGGALSLGRVEFAFLAWLLPLLWFAAGVTLFYPPVEKVFVRRFMGVPLVC